MRQRKLLHVFSTFAIGGPQIRFSQLANRFGDRYRHTLVAMDGNYACRERINASVALELLPLRLCRGGFPANVLTYRHVIAEVQPDLLVTYNWGAIEWAFGDRWRPICNHIHQEDGFGPEEATKQLLRRVLIRRLALSGRHTTVVVPSRTLLRIVTAVWCLPNDCVQFVPNGVDCDRFARPDFATADRLFPRATDEIIVGTVAKLRPEKNIGRLICAFAAVSHDLKSRLMIVGDGAELGQLKQIAAENGISARVVFAGAVDAPEHLLAQMDVFALSSDTEQMPLSVIEAMAAGRPIAGLDVGDVKDVVAVENRPFIAAQQDESKFRQVLRTLMVDAQARATIGDANRIAATERFDQDRMFAAYAGLFG